MLRGSRREVDVAIIVEKDSAVRRVRQDSI